MLKLLPRQLPSIRLILGIAFLIRLIVFGVSFWQANDLTVFHAKDTATYLAPAQELFTSGNFAVNNRPEVIRTPGYPIFLIIGIVAHQTEIITILLQIILSVASCYVLFLTGKIVTNEAGGKLTALLFSFEPLSITYTCYLLSETLFTFLFLLSFYQLILILKKADYLKLIAMMVLFSAAIYVRPVAYYLIVLWMLMFFLKGKKHLLSTIISLLLIVPMLGFWHVRNMNRANYAGFSAVSDVMLYFYHASSIEAQKQNLPLRQIIESKGYYDVGMYYQIHPEQQGWTEAERYKFWRQQGITAIRESPFTFTGIYGKGLIFTLLDPGSTDFLRLLDLYPESGNFITTLKSEGIVNVISQNKSLVFISFLFLTYLICTYFFSLTGIYNLLKIDPSSGLLIVLTCLYFLFLSGGVIAIARLRAPMMPILLIATGHGLSLTLQKLKPNHPPLSDL